MAINKNHEFEDLNGIKCAVVEKDVLPSRVAFLKELLEANGYTTVIVASPPPKTAPAATAVEGEAPASATPQEPGTFTVGVTDVMFNSTNAIFGRLLKTPNGRVVTYAYWHQKESISHDDIPYFENP